MLSVRTDFEMTYNIKELTIFAGLLCMILAFMNAGVMYLCCKTKNDFNAKKSKLEAEGALDE